MYSNKKKIVVAAFIVMLAVVLATSTTYAWLSMDTSPEVRYFDVNVTAGDSMTIAVTTIGAPTPGLSEYKTFVDSGDITPVAKFYDLGNNIKASAKSLTTATTQNAENFMLIDEVKALEADEGAYYGFDIHFMGNDAFNVRLAKNTTVTSQEGVTSMPAYYWQGAINDGYATQDKLNQVIPAKAANAARIAFGDKIFEPNHNAGYGNFGGDKNIAIDYFNRMRGGTPIKAPAAPLVFNSSELNGYTHTLTTLEQQSVGFYTAKLSIKIWLEGWDADAFDSIKNQVLTTFIRFEGDLNEDILALDKVNDNVVYNGLEQDIDNIIELADSPSEGALYYSYKKQGSTDAFNPNLEIINAGFYTARLVRLAFSDATISYPDSVIYVNFEIKKANNVLDIEANDIDYGSSLDISVLTNENGGEVTYEYKVQGATDNTYSVTEPTDARAYTVRATSAATANYLSATATADFEIEKIDNTLLITANDIVFGESLSIIINSNLSGGVLSFKYKEASEDESEYSQTMPNLPGDYNVKVTSAATTNYNEAIATAEFIINKANFDMSGVSWDYVGPFIYVDGLEREVLLIGLPEGLKVGEYTDNKKIHVDSYTATVTFVIDEDHPDFDNVYKNYNVPSEFSNWDLHWEIIG